MQSSKPLHADIMLLQKDLTPSPIEVCTNNCLCFNYNVSKSIYVFETLAWCHASANINAPNIACNYFHFQLHCYLLVVLSNIVNIISTASYSYKHSSQNVIQLIVCCFHYQILTWVLKHVYIIQ